MSKKKVVKIRTYITEKENRHIIEGIVKENSRGFENTIIVKSFFQKKKKKITNNCPKWKKGHHYTKIEKIIRKQYFGTTTCKTFESLYELGIFHKTPIRSSKTKMNLTINSLFKTFSHTHTKTISLDGFTVNSIKYFKKE